MTTHAWNQELDTLPPLTRSLIECHGSPRPAIFEGPDGRPYAFAVLLDVIRDLELRVIALEATP